MIYHVSVNGNDGNDGSEKTPFRTIGKAACAVTAGDTVLVHGGTYREWVAPEIGGTSDLCRVTFEAAVGEHPVIKGSEPVTDWEHVEGTVYKKTLPNDFFGDFNPYAEILSGDWLRQPHESGYDVHLGDVYVNGTSMYEASSMEDLFEAAPRTVGCRGGVSAFPEPIPRPEETVYRWFSEVSETETTVYGNFGNMDPNEETVEINVRKCCFFPKKTGIDYVTLRGFEIAHAATPFAPPTAEQFGMVGPHWAKGWIIEDCDLHDAKCCAVSIGKYGSERDNLAFRVGRKSGHRYQLESVYEALGFGWTKDRVGSHVIRNNEIHDCGQCGIVGNLGGVFSRIEGNHVHSIAVKQEFWGHELGGIKLHAPIDVVIEENHIHDCSTFGIWLDWQAQGTRVTRNLFHGNLGDLKIEVTHGPCTVDNNLLLSPYTLVNHAQGTAFIHNLIAGYVYHIPVRDRATPYHFPHSTAPLGYVAVYGGDDRVYGNIFIGADPPPDKMGLFSSCYDRYTTPEEYRDTVKPGGRHIADRVHTDTPQPVRIAGNVYCGYARPYRREQDALRTHGLAFELTEAGGSWSITLTVPPEVAGKTSPPVSTESLGTPRITEAPYDAPDGSPLDLAPDFFGVRRTEQSPPGPFASLKAGKTTRVLRE